MTSQLIFSVSNLAQRASCDRRAIYRRLVKFQISPDFITPNGEQFFLPATADALLLAELEVEPVAGQEVAVS